MTPAPASSPTKRQRAAAWLKVLVRRPLFWRFASPAIAAGVVFACHHVLPPEQHQVCARAEQALPRVLAWVAEQATGIPSSSSPASSLDGGT